jgi:hypothetical protein
MSSLRLIQWYHSRADLICMGVGPFNVYVAITAEILCKYYLRKLVLTVSKMKKILAADILIMEPKRRVHNHHFRSHEEAL